MAGDRYSNLRKGGGAEDEDGVAATKRDEEVATGDGNAATRNENDAAVMAKDTAAARKWDEEMATDDGEAAAKKRDEAATEKS